MDAQFWINAWNEGRTAFHRQTYHEKLLEYFPDFKPHDGQKVLVPLCGKTKDMIWLHDLKLQVHGVELFEKAVESFFEENKLLPVVKSQYKEFNRYKFKNITIDCGDFFKLDANESYDFIYDRASLVALPVEMRRQYSEVIKRSLKPGGKCLLIVYEYDQSKMEGPPFSVTGEEIHNLYSDQFKIKLMETLRPLMEGSRLETVESIRQMVYILEKTV